MGIYSIVSTVKILNNKIRNVTTCKLVIKRICRVFTVLFTLKLRNSILKDVFRTLSQEVGEAARNFESFNYWTWLTLFIKTQKTKSDVSVKVALG